MHNMTTAPVPALSSAERRRRVAVGLLRSLAITVVLLAVYYLLPLEGLSSLPIWLTLAAGMLALAAVAAYQVRAVIRARHRPSRRSKRLPPRHRCFSCSSRPRTS